MDALEFEYALRKHVADAKAKLTAYSDELDGKVTIKLEAEGVNRVQWTLDYYVYDGPNIAVSGAELMLCVDQFTYQYHMRQANRDLRLLPSPAEPVTNEGDDNARSTQEATYD